MTAQLERTPDITVFDHGSILGFKPNTEFGETWIDENVDPDAPWFGSQLIVEPRYAETLVTAMTEAGLILSTLGESEASS